MTITGTETGTETGESEYLSLGSINFDRQTDLANSITEKDWEAMIADPHIFFELVTGLEPYQYQVDLLEDESRQITLRVSRQGGKTFTVAIKIVRFVLMNPGKMVLLISPSINQTSILFRRVLAIFEQNPFLQKFVDFAQRQSIKLKNGASVRAVAASGVRGFGPNLLVIDEAAFVGDDVFMSADPSLAATRGQLILMSTPYGKQGRFYKSFQMDRYNKYHVPATDIDHLTRDNWLVEKRKEITDREYQQEYMAEFVEDADNYFSSEEIKCATCDYPLLDMPVEPDKYYYYLGVDLAREGEDETVYVISKFPKDRTGEGIEIVHIFSTSKKPLTDAMGRILNYHKIWNFERIFIDSTGMGSGVFDVIYENNLPVTPITFNEVCKFDKLRDSNKEAMYKNLKWLFEQNMRLEKEGFTSKKAIKIPYHVRLINQLQDMYYEFTSSGGLKIHHRDGGHDDFCFAAGTMILTDEGQKPIEEINIGDKVMTRNGYHSVVGIGNRMAVVIEKIGLVGTPDHPIITTTGTEKLININSTHRLFKWNQKQSRIEEKSITDILSLQEDTYRFITGITESGRKRQSHCIDRFGKITTERFPKDTLSTTKMEAHSTMNYKISNVCKEVGTNQTMLERQNEKKSAYERSINAQELRRQNGMEVQKGLNGIKNIIAKCVKPFMIGRTSTSVRNAEKNISLTGSHEQGSVQDRAEEKVTIDGRQSTGNKTVYNLLIEGSHEYFANDILVHNCDGLALSTFFSVGQQFSPILTNLKMKDEPLPTDPTLMNFEEKLRQGYLRKVT